VTAPHTVLRSPNPINVTSSGGISRAYSLWRLGGSAECHVLNHVTGYASNSLRRFLRETLTTEHGSESRLACSTYLNRSCTLRNLLLFLL